MAPSILQLALTLWLPFLLSIISSFVPEDLNHELKIKLLKKSLDTSVIFIRSQGFEATYNDLEVNLLEDSIEIKNINLRRQFYPNEFTFCDVKKIKQESIWDPEVCELSINIESLKFSGLNLIEKNNKFFTITANNINFDTSIFNDSSSIATKKLYEIEKTIVASFSIKNQYEFNKNIFENKIDINIKNYGDVSLKTRLTNLLYNQKKFSAVLDELNFKFTNYGILEKIDTFFDIETNTNLTEVTKNALKSRSLLNIEDENEIYRIKSHNETIDNINRHYPSLNNNIDNILLFLDKHNSIQCTRNEDHLLNENVIEGIDSSGPILFLAVFCEQIINFDK
jgi:hypothetical protein|tara:strand:+ start:878 stop:1894 length:1017 start_codon:yes stop_codon:yes gene_type:complete